MSPRYIPYADLHDLSEDERIKIMGNVASEGKTIGVMVDDDPEKVARYISKMTSRYPCVRLIEQLDSPIAGVVMLRFGPRLAS
ncbi:MAG: hypothetical protein IIB77_05345 [Proteobacteria bacterium]|nr:hypothetical protein [Pseudomonadota bacterium]